MSNSATELRRQIASASDLQAVVRTMKTLAAANIGQYERSVQALADYYLTVELGLGACLRSVALGITDAVPDAGGGQHHGRSVLAVVFGSDQGLVGQFNDLITDHAARTLRDLVAAANPDVRVWAVGERVQARLLDAGIPVARVLTVPNSVRAITPLVGQVLIETETLRIADGGSGELHLFHNRPGAAVEVEPGHLRLLPLDVEWLHARAALPWPTGNLPEMLASSTGTLRALIREYLFISLFRACAESLASENASRLTALQRAERNIEDLLAVLTNRWQRLRQSAIDEELFDVVAGFEALAGSADGLV